MNPRLAKSKRALTASASAAAALWLGGVSPVLADVAAGSSSLHGRLDTGRHGVGVMHLVLRDRQRPEGAAMRDGRAVTLDERARVVRLQVWYPTSPAAGGPAMTVADYLDAHLPDLPDEATRGSRRRERVANFRQTMTTFGRLTDAQLETLLEQRFLARREAPPAPGPFPLIVGQLRPFATTIVNEHLASHGYVVAMVSGTSPSTPDAGAGLEVAVRDMELAIADLRTRAWVHPTSLATLGFSGAGFSQLLLAMRHPDVQAVCDLESAIFDDRVMWPLSRGWGYDVAALRVPFLHTYGVPLSARENRRADFEAMRYARRYHYLVDAPGLTHGDFASEGMIASLTPGLRGDAAPRLQAAFETTVRYVRAFMDAHVKGDSAAAAFLTRRPEDNGVPPGLATVRVLAAIEPAPTADGLEAQIRGDGIESALRTLREAAVRDPEAPLFAERALNALGYRLFRDGRHADAVAILQTMLDRYPASPNAYDSLSEVLEAAGRREESRTVVLRGLDVVQAPAVSTGDRDAFTRMLRERLARLDRSGPAPPP
jgi:hypothetical protein